MCKALCSSGKTWSVYGLWRLIPTKMLVVYEFLLVTRRFSRPATFCCLSCSYFFPFCSLQEILVINCSICIPLPPLVQAFTWWWSKGSCKIEKDRWRKHWGLLKQVQRKGNKSETRLVLISLGNSPCILLLLSGF